MLPWSRALSKPLPRALPGFWAETLGEGCGVAVAIAIPTGSRGFGMGMWCKADQPLLLWFVKLTAKGQEEMDTALLVFPYLLLEILSILSEMRGKPCSSQHCPG